MLHQHLHHGFEENELAMYRFVPAPLAESASAVPSSRPALDPFDMDNAAHEAKEDATDGRPSGHQAVTSRSFRVLVGLVFWLFCSVGEAFTLTGTVVRVADGDTLTVLDASRKQHRIRLAGIDAPERKQPFGSASRKHLAGLVLKKRVIVEYTKRDRYGRIAGKVMVQGVDAGLAQIAAGMAWHYRAFAFEQPRSDRVLYAWAEVDARSARLGLWTIAAPVPPWHYRYTEDH